MSARPGSIHSESTSARPTGPGFSKEEKDMFTSKSITVILVSSSLVRGQTPNYDFGKQIRAIQDTPPEQPVAPQGLQLKKDVRLDATALEAVQVSQKWRDEKAVTAAGSDGRVMYTFGAGLPTIVCAPLRVCMIE